MTVKQALNWGAQQLKHIPYSISESELILAHILHTNKEQLLTNENRTVKLTQYNKFKKNIQSRKKLIPMAYILGYKYFYNLKFQVTKDVLIPRPDTENLIDEAIKTIKQNTDIKNIVDIGTGSGCIAITLAKYFPNRQIIATDISPKALSIAKKNAKLCQVNNILFKKGDSLNPFIKNSLLKNSLIISNPPYLLPRDIKHEIKFEPKAALIGGKNGLDWYKNFTQLIGKVAQDNLPKVIILEIHSPLLTKIIKIIKPTLGRYKLSIHKDLSRLPRYIKLTL